MSEEPEIEIDWEQHFPNMTPVGGVPTLRTINGCGFSLYGSRDHDSATGTYVKTHVFVLIFIPIFALKSFRVADAETGGWHFVGREPLSGLASGWNKLLFMFLFAIIGGGMWNAHNNSPEKQAARTLAQAQSIQAAGDIPAAANAYQGLLGGPQHVAAVEALNAIIQVDLPTQSPTNQARLLDFFVRSERNTHTRLGNDYLAIGLQYAQAAQENDIDGAYQLLQAIRSLAGGLEDPIEYHNLYAAVLSTLVATSPDDLELLSEYAAVLEARNAEGDQARLIALLEPRRDTLGTTEGARILGEHEANQGNLGAALELLQPYTEARLQDYHDAETAYQEASERAWKLGVKQLEKGDAGPAWYKKYEAATEEQKGAMVDEWVSKRMEKSGDLSQHRDRFIEAATVVPQAMDLGILLLQHAQGIEDADARRKQLEHSESIFMSVQAAAGDNPQYQLFLGQVKYWLGKSAEGEGLFTQFLASGDPDRPPFTAMFAVAGTYRKVGEMAKARAIYEDVYSRAEDEDIKDSAANMRAVSATDTEDSIHWLKLCKNQRPNVLASLASNEGILALQNGDTDTAISKFNESINIYESMPEDAVNLNNSALVFNHLFDATGDIKHHEQGIQRLRKAHSLAPEDSITMGNFASNLRTASLIAVTRDTIDYPALRQEPRSDLLSAIATDRASRLALRKRLVENAQFREATSYLSKARVLSPKSISLYSQLTQMHTWRQDLSALTQLHQDLITAELDLSDMNAEFLDIYAGNQDADRLADSLQALTGLQARMESIGETTAATAAFMHIQVADAVENLWTHDRKLNPDLAIQAAEKAIDTHASQNARRTLASAYILRCAAATLPRTPVYTRFIAMNSVVNVVAVALNSGDSTLREAILAHDDFKKGLAIHKQEALADANYQHPWLWAMARHADAEFANTVAATVKADEISRANRAIIGVLTPLAGNTIYGSAWAAELVGDKAAADKILAQAKAAGVPLPQ